MKILGQNAIALTLLTMCMWAGAALAQVPCANRGDLDQRYCDEDGDLLADRPKDAESLAEPRIARLFIHAGRGSGRVRERLCRFHGAPHEGHGKTDPLVPRGVLRRASRGDALRAAAYRGRRNRPNGVRSKPRRLRPARRDGARRRQRRLHADRDHAPGQPDQDARGSQRQARRARVAVVQLRRHRTARSLQDARHRARQGLPGAVFGQARQLDHGRRQQGLRCRAGGQHRDGAHAGARHVQARNAARHLRVVALPAHFFRRRPQPHARASGEDPRSVHHVRLQEIEARHGVQGHRALRPDQLQGALARRAHDPESDRRHATRRRVSRSSARSRNRRAGSIGAWGTPGQQTGAASAAFHREPHQGLSRRPACARWRELRRRAARGRRDHRLVRGGKKHADPLHQPAGRAHVGRYPARRRGHRRHVAAASCARRAGASA